MAIKVGDPLPADVKLKEMKDGGPKEIGRASCRERV